MYACVVKNDQETWDIYGFAAYTSNTEKQARLEAAVESGLPITAMLLTPYQWSATPGAIWDGENFTGGPDSVIPSTVDWNYIQTYGFLCDNVLVYGMVVTVGSEREQQLNAIFAGDVENTIIKVPENQVAKLWDTWDGTNIISQ